MSLSRAEPLFYHEFRPLSKMGILNDIAYDSVVPVYTMVSFKQLLGGWAQSIQSKLPSDKETFIGTSNDDREKISENKKG